jgi:O-succinylbenzoate synthase
MRLNFQHRRYRLPFRATVRTAHGPWAEREGVYVRLETEDGRVAFAEAAPIPSFGTETVEEIDDVCRELGEWPEDTNLTDLPDRLICLRNAIGTALPQLRTTEDSTPAAAEEISPWGVAAFLPAGRAALAQISPKADAGFRIFKWKVGVGDIDEELGLLDDICSLLPDGAKLRLDANGGWNVKQASRWLERCAERPIEFLEQPVAPDSRGAKDVLLGLAGDFPTLIGLDESLISDGDVEGWLADGWRDIFVVKPMLLGDPPATLKRLARAQADVVFSSALETAVGARDSLRIAFGWKGPKRALGFGVGPLFTDSRFDGPHAAPFIDRADIERIQPESLWNALT